MHDGTARPGGQKPLWAEPLRKEGGKEAKFVIHLGPQRSLTLPVVPAFRSQSVSLVSSVAHSRVAVPEVVHRSGAHQAPKDLGQELR